MTNENNLTDKLLIKEDDCENEISIKELFYTCIYLGLVSFGGPIAHIGMFNQVFIKQKKLISEKDFSELFALCNILPGPTSSQLLTAIAVVKTKSIIGGIVSFIGFNFPGLIIMIIFGSIMKNYSLRFDTILNNYWILNAITYGIWQAAVSIVLQAAISLSKNIKNSKLQLFILITSSIFYLIFNSYVTMIILMISGGFISYISSTRMTNTGISYIKVDKNIQFLGIPSLITFFLIYVTLNIAKYYTDNLNIFLTESFYRIGSLIIGGGHVVIPMILTEFSKLISEKDILYAFSIVSLVPGPMFNIAGYIGALINGFTGGFFSALAIFTPGMLLLFSTLRFINFINDRKNLQSILRGISSAAIGFIFSSCFLLWYSSCVINSKFNFEIILGTLNVVCCFNLLEFKKLNAIFVIGIGALNSIILTLVLNFFISKY